MFSSDFTNIFKKPFSIKHLQVNCCELILAISTATFFWKHCEIKKDIGSSSIFAEIVWSSIQTIYEEIGILTSEIDPQRRDLSSKVNAVNWLQRNIKSEHNMNRPEKP